MTKQKKSFLDKIIGSGTNKAKQANEENYQPREESKNTDTAAGKFLEAESAAKIDGNNIKKEAVDEANNKKREWFENKEAEGEEGQLTVDVYQTKDLIVIKSIIGGVRPEDLDISVTSDMVTIKGSRKKLEEVEPDDYYYQECFWGSFSRSVILPCDIKAEGVEAAMKNGILTIKLPKIEKNSSMKIEVRGE